MHSECGGPALQGHHGEHLTPPRCYTTSRDTAARVIEPNSVEVIVARRDSLKTSGYSRCSAVNRLRILFVDGVKMPTKDKYGNS